MCEDDSDTKMRKKSPPWYFQQWVGESMPLIKGGRVSAEAAGTAAAQQNKTMRPWCAWLSAGLAPSWGTGFFEPTVGFCSYLELLTEYVKTEFVFKQHECSVQRQPDHSGSILRPDRPKG